MAVIIGLGAWIALNAAIAVALLLRRDRPEAREQLFKWALKDARQRSTRERKEPALVNRRR
jgi:hypothetical protein